MSGRFPFTYTRLTVAILGVMALVIGGVLAYFAFSVDWGVGPRILTPLGVLIALIGVVLLLSKDE